MKELKEIQQELSVPKGQYNEFSNFYYRSCEDILGAVKPYLKEHDLFLLLNDELINIGDRFYIKATATLTNKDGEVVKVTGYAREEDQRKGMDASQITGAASSYARKYALNGMFLIDDGEDADSMDNREVTEKKVPYVKQMENPLTDRPATPKQLKYLKDLGVAVPEGITAEEAKVLIGGIVDAKKK